MVIARINKSVLKVVQLQEDASGKLSPVVLYKRTGKKKRITGPLKPLERAIRLMAKAQSSFTDKYLERHARSNEKSRDGFIRDMVPNLIDAGNSGRKKLGIKKMVMMP